MTGEGLTMTVAPDGDGFVSWNQYRRANLDCGTELRIHPEIERGDNATIKMGGENKGQSTGGCCAGSS